MGTTIYGVPVVSIQAAINTTPTNSAFLPWNNLSKPYQWTTSLAITTQNNSGLIIRQKEQYNGQDVNVGMWIASISTGLAWKIVSISSKSTSTVACTLEDTSRYNTYRDATKTGNGKPPTGTYVVFSLSQDGFPVIDPAPTGVGANFLSSLISRFQYINDQNDFTILQSGIPGPLATVTVSNGGSGYVNGTYTNVPFTNVSSSGSSAQATVIVAGGKVADVVVTAIGSGYVTSPYPSQDTLSFNNTSIGGTGSGVVCTATANFAFGDSIALDEPTGTFVLTDGTHLNVVGTCTGTDDTGSYFSINAIQKINDTLNYLPGVIGDIIYTDPNNPGGFTTTAGGTEVYLKLRQQTSTTTVSSTFGSATTTITTAGNTFNINGVLAVVGGTGTLTDVNTAINAISNASGVSSTISGSFFLTITAVDAREIGFEDISGSTTIDVGLSSAENGTKAAGMYITNARSSAAFSNVIGYTFTQAVANTTWAITHSANTANYIAQIFDGTGAVIFPDTITTVDVNNVQVTFANAQAGKAQLSLFIPNPV